MMRIQTFNSKNNRKNYTWSKNLVSAGLILLTMPLLCGFSFGQDYLPGITPAALVRGTGSGELEQIKPYNGSMTLALPLLNIGGRGRAGYQMTLRIGPHWMISGFYDDGQGGVPAPIAQLDTDVEYLSSSSYEPGQMVERHAGDQPFCNSNTGTFMKTITYFTFTGADGSTIDFYDDRYKGATLVQNCITPMSYDRGKVFYATDASGATFVSDSSVYDNNNGYSSGTASGLLKFRNGVTYRIVQSKVVYIEDQNGNRVTLNYANLPGGFLGRLMSVKDALGREFTITLSSGFTGYDEISYIGGTNAPRSIRIYKKYLAESLRSGSPLTTIENLFQTNEYYNYQEIINPPVISSVEFPADKEFQFSYNIYGELARIAFPTGAVTEYDYAAGLIGGPEGGGLGSNGFYRRLVERRVLTSGNNLSLRTTFSRPESGQFPWSNYINNGFVTIVNSNDSNGVLSATTQYFSGYGAIETMIHPYLLKDEFHQPWNTGLETQVDSLDTSLNVVGRLIKVWAPLAFRSWGGEAPVLSGERNVLQPLSSNLISQSLYQYDNLGNVTDTRVYDFGIGSPGVLLKRTHAEFTTPDSSCSESGTHLRSLPSQIWVSSDEAGNNKVSLTRFEYDNYAMDSNHAGLVTRSSTTGHDTTYGIYTTCRGNVTAVTSYSNAASQTGAVTAYSQYDILGNVVKTIDANGNATTIGYADNFGSPDGEATTNTAPSQLNGLNTYALATSATNPLGWTTYVQYDYFTGQPVNARDVNGIVSKTIYNDPLDRATQSVTAVGTSNEAQTTILYDDVNRKIQTTSDLFTLNDNFVRSESFYDGFGRTVETRSYKDGDYISVRTEYDGLGRVKRVTNPYRPSRNESELWTRTAYDELDRIVEIETPDGASVSTTYEGNTATVTDQAGKMRRSVTNALGQLIRVDEPNGAGQLGDTSSPNQATYYTYNALGKMVQVNQGIQNRYFLYDSLGRLLRVRQPEQEVNTYLNTSGNPGNNSWTAGFTYDANGNVLTTTDANNITITTAYDALNRQYLRTYSDATPDVSYAYDDQLVANSKGRVTKITSAISETRYTEYDENGKIKATEQATDGKTYASTYTYNLGGILTEQTYPSGRVVQNMVDSNGELSNIASRVANGMFKNYASNFEYTPSGVIKHLQLGNGLWESAELNTRNQVTELKMGHSATDGSLMHLNYDYGELDASGNVDATKNSGNIARQTITVTGLANPFVQTYKYDPLDRITEAKETVNGTQNWIQQFGYDRYGNRTALSETVQGQAKPINEVTLPSVDANTNRFASGTDYEYDAVGNLIRDAHGRQFTFNGDNKQIEVKDQFDTVVGTYLYDGNGKRVKKIVPSTDETTIFVYDGLGKLIAEYSTEPPANPTVNYTATDPLGSPRVITNKQGEVVSRRDFMPFGEEIAPDEAYRTAALKYGISDGVRQKFTGYQRDEETDLDFAEARYYYNDHGRFTAVDPLLASGKSVNPQTFNRYVYVLNNPLRLVDPTGKSPSTHVDEDGKVVAVIDDGDLGVYQHKNNADGKAPTEYMIKKRQQKSGSTAAGGTKIGQTVIWHEFRNHDKAGNPTSEIAKGAQIVRGLDFLPVVNAINQAAKELTLGTVMNLSKNGQPFDIKTNTTLAPYGPNTGGLLGSNFVTARSAGNFLAGMNGANVSTSSYVNDYVSLDAYMRVAGEYEQTGKMDATTAAGLRTGAISPTVNVAPYYGESSYSGLYIMAGYEYGKWWR